MKKLCITRILSASFFLFFGSIAMACSPPPPTFDPTGKPVYPPEPTFRYEFTGVVVGEAEGTSEGLTGIEQSLLRTLRSQQTGVPARSCPEPTYIKRTRII